MKEQVDFWPAHALCTVGSRGYQTTLCTTDLRQSQSLSVRTGPKFRVDNNSRKVVQLRHTNAYHMCKSQGGLIANIKFHDHFITLRFIIFNSSHRGNRTWGTVSLHFRGGLGGTPPGNFCKNRIKTVHFVACFLSKVENIQLPANFLVAIKICTVVK